jgi:hypothetical protein
MIRLLTTGLLALVLGLGLFVIRRALIAGGSSLGTQGMRQLTLMGVGIIFAGILIVGVGMWMAISGKQIQDWSAILSTGAAVIAVGCNSIVRAFGRGHERAIWNGAWAAVAIGILLYLIYFFAMPYIQKLIGGGW